MSRYYYLVLIVIFSVYILDDPSSDKTSGGLLFAFAASVQTPSYHSTGASHTASRKVNKSLPKWLTIQSVIKGPLIVASKVVGKPIRDVNFWGKALTIYGSYKVHQVKSKIGSSINVRGRRDPNWKEIKQNKTDEMWNFIHEENSQRMVDLCLGMRGFYLKTGQFLGTRHDFMPKHYTSKLSKLHDDVPPIPANVVQRILEQELGGPLENFFTFIDLKKPIGSASVAQVHQGTWRETGEKVAVKVQYPNAERLMIGDLRNLRVLAEFLQRTEFKFDLLSSIKELQKQIVNEFDFRLEARNMDFMRRTLASSVKEVSVPQSIFSTKKALVMTFVDGVNLCKMAEFKNNSRIAVPSLVKARIGTNLLNVLAKAWGEMIFELNFFNADPHPGNVCIGRRSIGLLDWGQMKRMHQNSVYQFAKMVDAINSKNQTKILQNFYGLGIKVTDTSDTDFVEKMALTMLDTRKVPGLVLDPFSKDSSVGKNTVAAMPSDFYFLVRTVQLMRGIAYAFDLDFSLAEKWGPYAKRAISRMNNQIAREQKNKKKIHGANV